MSDYSDTFGNVSRYRSIKLTNVASVYIAFPGHTCGCANLSTSNHLSLIFPGTLQSCSSVSFFEGCPDIFHEKYKVFMLV